MGESNKFILSRERRYGLWAESYSALNGYVRNGEVANQSAARILLNDYALQAPTLFYLGAFRIQVNRGGGFLHSFIALNATRIDDISSRKKRVLVSKHELLKMLLSKDRVLEAQWASTLALAVLWHDKNA